MVSLKSAANGISLQYFPAGPTGFFRAPVLLSGAEEVVLIDAGFTLSDGRLVADAIKATGKRLTTIYISQSDPDYYFGLGVIRAAFPDAALIAAPETVDAIERSVTGKLKVWGPQLGDNGPQTLADIVIPERYALSSFAVDGAAIEIVEAKGLTNRRHLYVPALNAVVGGVLVFAGVHVWTADTKGAEGFAAWRATLEALLSRAPAVVIPGHMALGTACDRSALEYTLDYLTTFENELASAPDAATLVARMKERFPASEMDVAIEIGAKVATGEMSWG